MRVQRMRAVATAWVVAATSTLANGQAGCEGRSEVLESFRPRSGPAVFTLEGRVYMTGGGGTSDSAVWVLGDDGRWSRTGSQPAPSTRLCAVEHRAEGLVYAATDTGGTYTWDGQTWTLISAGAPDDPGSLMYDSLRERILLSAEGYFGGGGLFAFEDGRWVMLGDDVPGVASVQAVYDAQRDVVVLFGGLREDFYCDDSSLAGLWEFAFDSGRWEQVIEAGDWPARRAGHGMYFDDQAGVTVVTSGEHRFDQCHACAVQYYPRPDVWEWDGVAWHRAGSAPGNVGNSVVYDYAHERGILVGGGQFRLSSPDCGWMEWYFDHSKQRTRGSWTDLAPTVRPARYDKHRMAFHPGRDGVISHGGSYYDDTYQYTETVDNSYLYDRQGRFEYVADGYWASAVGLAYDQMRMKMVGFGGLEEDSIRKSGTYTLDASGDWTRRSVPTEPPPRADQAMAWHPGLERVVMYGGTHSSVDDRHAWLWDGTDWTEHPASGPTDRFSASMAYDAQLDLLVTLVNGGETWLFDPTASGGPGDPAWIDAGAQLPVGKANIIEIPGFGILGGARDNTLDALYRWNSRSMIWEPIGSREPGFVADFAYDPVLGAVVFSSEREWKVAHWFPPCKVDLDCDGTTTIFDFLAFQTAFDAADPRADFDEDGQFTIFDFLAFVDQFEDGCS
ncbi:MAG: GC-type dockerin domain-anchored protein [Phycisphaerales bacterium JB060]